MEDMEDVNIIPVENAELFFQQDKAAIDIQVSTAHAYPRNLLRSIENSVVLATLDNKTAESCNYAVPRGGKRISGPSIHLAKILAQNWGNMRVEAKVVSIEYKHITSQAVVWDLENNLAIKVEVKRSIMTSTGRMNDDMITVTGNAANSISMRNAILSVIPRQVVDKVYDAAKRKITGDLSTEEQLLAKRKTVLDAMKGAYNITEEEILYSIGKGSINHIGPDEILTLIGIGQAIKDGDTTVEQTFKKKGKDKPEKETSEQVAEKRILAVINHCKTIAELEDVQQKNPNINIEIYTKKREELTNAK